MSEPATNGHVAPNAEDRFLGRIQGARSTVRQMAERAAQSLLDPEHSPRKQQVDCIEASLKNRHVLAQMPTGEGKSLVFHTLARIKKTLTGSGDVLVISPSTALSDDHVRNARKLGLRAYTTHGKLRMSERNAAIKAWRQGECDVLVISPEALDVESSNLLAALCSSRPPSRIVLDEAHLYQSWGLGFRPAYRKLRNNLEEIYADTLQAIPWVLLSATLKDVAERDLAQNLKLSHNLFRYRGSVLRSNIRIRLAPVPGTEVKDYPRFLLPLVDQNPGPSIIYAQYANDTEKLYKIFRDEWKRKVVRYHAQMRPSEERPMGWQQEAAETFARGEADCMIATVAYGMGINLPNEVSSVVLLGPPSSVAEVVQMIGRCGRKGSDSLATILHSPSLLQKQKVLTNGSWPVPEYLLGILDEHSEQQGEFRYVSLPGVPRDEEGELQVNEVGNILRGGGQSLERRGAVNHLLGMGLLEDMRAGTWHDPHGRQNYRVAPDARDHVQERMENYQAHRGDTLNDAAEMRRFVRNVAAGACAQEEILKAFSDPIRGKCESVGALLCSSCDQEASLGTAHAAARDVVRQAASWLPPVPGSETQVAMG